ncbi:MAG: IS200/IS605 family transposase, partial [Rickettsia endosymbiont of Ixodes persulcatus]|nr:IS200/IS605 family transposase [Rickettsia endosymbiont of Ixodes persulcatus]
MKLFYCPKFGRETLHCKCGVLTYRMWRCSITRRQATYDILRGKVASNHVHIYVSVQPYQSISKVVQYLKGKSSRKIQQEFPELRKQYW